MRLPYGEGTWFAVPLRSGGYGVGGVARSTAEGKVILGYFFGPRRQRVPTLVDVFSLRPDQAVAALRFGDLGLIQGEWPVLGQATGWRRSEWRMPEFVRTEPITNRSFRVRYSDADPNQVLEEEPMSRPEPRLTRDSLLGAGALEVTLSRLLA